MNIFSKSLFRNYRDTESVASVCQRTDATGWLNFPYDHSPRRLSHIILPDGQLLLFISVVQVLALLHEYSIPLPATVQALLRARSLSLIALYRPVVDPLKCKSS